MWHKAKKVKKATSTYIGDIFVMIVLYVKEYLSRFGFDSRDPGRLREGTKLFGFKVWWGGGNALR